MLGNDSTAEPDATAGLGIGADAALAIISATAVEHALTRLIKRRCQYDKSVHDRMFDGVGPFASFEARINLAFLLGLLRKSTMHELKLVNRISVLFSDRPATLDFGAKPIQELVVALTRSNRTSQRNANGLDGLTEASGKYHFVSTCKRLANVFSSAAAQSVEPIGPFL
jgi:hypothetical protein